MSKKKIIGISIAVIIGLIIILSLVFYTIDYSKVAKNEAPIFTKHMKVFITDTPIPGYDVYYGLGYKIIIVKISDDENYTKISPIWEEDDISEALKRVEEINATKEYRDKELEELPQNYTLEQAVRDGCFVVTYNRVYNKNRLDSFIENTGMQPQNRIEDKIRIVLYTDEGDPIIIDLEYKITDETYLLSGKPVNKTKYIMRVDNTRDEFAAEVDRKITENDRIPGEIYGITTWEDGEKIMVGIDLYALVDYVDDSVEPYDTIVICSYSKDSEIINNFNN